MIDRKKLAQAIKAVRKEHGYSQAKVAEALGIKRQAVTMWEREQRTPALTSLEALADLFNVPMSVFINEADHRAMLLEESKKDLPSNMELPALRTLPVLGTIGAGEPLTATAEAPESAIRVPEHIHGDLGLIVGGDSMQPTVMLGDYVIIHSQPDVEDGEIAAVQITEHDTSEAVLKRVHHIDGGILLISDNSKYPPRMVRKTEYNKIEIIGKAISFIRSL